MDSFLDEPRSTPKPTPVIQEISTPTVPEVSLMFQNINKDKSTRINHGKTLQSYNAWKLRSSASPMSEYDSFLVAGANNKENVCNMQPNPQERSFLSKKQVRFESPILHRTNPMNVSNSKSNIASSVKKGFDVTMPQTKSIEQVKSIDYANMSNQRLGMATRAPVLQDVPPPPHNKSKPFEKLYVSNIPNRALELSFLEPARAPCPTNNQLRTSARPVPCESPLIRYPAVVRDYNMNFGTHNQFPAMENFPKRPDIGKQSIEKPDNDSVELNKTSDEQDLVTETKVNDEVNESRVEKSSCSQSDEETSNKDSSKNAPTVSDLLAVIKLQNEQLQLLQSQVQKLLQYNEKSKEEKSHEQMDTPKTMMYRDQQEGPGFKQVDEIIVAENPQENNQKKISVGLMTSFEVSFKPPVAAKKKHKTRNLLPVDDFSSAPARYTERVNHYKNLLPEEDFSSSPARYTERDNHYKKYRHAQDLEKAERNSYQREASVYAADVWEQRRTNETDFSLGPQESLEVQEPAESPENSIHIDMQEYDTDTDSSDDECSSEDTDWTFYQDILGQVNNILENSAPPGHGSNKRKETKNYRKQHTTDTTLEQIKNAALERLRDDGFLQPMDGGQCPMNPNEVSYALKQIMMKYLPDEGLASVAARGRAGGRHKSDQRRPTDVSVASFKYLQQCNVVTNAPPCYGRKPKANASHKMLHKNKRYPSSGDPKILDITTLKQQPKLL